MSGSTDLQTQRRKAVMTAVALAVVALLIFTAFILSGVLAS